MNRAFFNEQFAAMVNAYTISQKLSDESQDVYWTMLGDIPEKQFGAGVRKCLASCKFFPTIAELGEASLPTVTRFGPYNPFREATKTLITWDQQARELRNKKQLENAQRQLTQQAAQLKGEL